MRISSRISLLLALAVALALVTVAAWWYVQRSDAQRTTGEPDRSSELAQIVAPPPTEADAELDEGSTMVPTTPSLDRTVRGQVVRPTGEPAHGAQVVLQAPGSDERLVVTTDPGGLFRFEDVPAGLWVIEASREGFGPVAQLGVQPGPAQIRLVLQAGRDLEGVVLHGNEPLPRAVVHLGGAGLFPQRYTLADDTGRFRLSGVRPGTWEVAVTSPGLGTGFGTTLVLDDMDGTGAMPLDLQVRAAPTQMIRVQDRTTGSPVDQAVLTLSAAPLHVLALHAFAENGLAVIDYLPRGDYWLSVRAPGYLPWSNRLRISSTPSELTVELRPGATLAGRVRDEAGNPVEGVRLAALVETPTGARWELDQNIFADFHRLARPDGSSVWLPPVGYTTDAQGAFRIAGIPAGEATLTARATGYAPAHSAPLTLQDDQVYEPIELVLRRGSRVRGRVEDSAGGGVPDAWVSIRPRGQPDWAARAGVGTDHAGMFLLEDAPRDATLTVRHADFAPQSLDLEVPAGGLDDLIVRLSGEMLPSLSGRVLTEDGRYAVGARVWVMHGANELPACRASVDIDGFFHATQCSNRPERLIIVHEEHAPLIAELGGNLVARDWRLRAGGELDIVSQRTPVVASVEPLMILPATLWPRPRMDLERWGRVRIEHVAPGPYRVTCESEGFGNQVIDVQVRHGERVQAACPSLDRLMDFEIVVTDPMGAPVPEALLLADGSDPPIRQLTRSDGRISLQLPPGTRLRTEAVHEDWGRGSLSIYVPWQPPEGPFEIRLSEGVWGEDIDAFFGELADWGVRAVQDNRSAIVDRVASGTPAAGTGLRRLDRILWARSISAFRFSIGVRRGSDIVTFDLIRQPG